MISIFLLFGATSCAQDVKNTKSATVSQSNTEMVDKVVKSDDEWKIILTPEQYQVLRQQGTD